MRAKHTISAAKTYKKKYVLPWSRKQSETGEDSQSGSVSGGKSVATKKTKGIDVEEYEWQKQEIMRLRRLTQT